MNFVALDVETANPDISSICQIGLVKYTNGQLDDEWKSYVDPEDYFDDTNVFIHGINESTVKGAPNFPEIADILYSYLKGYIVVCHTSFDRVAIHKATSRYKIPPIELKWLDSARVARRTWKEFAWRGYNLKNICNTIGYDFNHHDALEDAKATAQVIIAAVDKSQLNLNEWLKRVEQPIDPSKTSSKIACEGNPEGAFFGECLVFTGALDMPRREAASLAASVGFQVSSGVTQKTTFLVVGDQDITRLAGHKKSSKHRKAEELIRKGFPIKIIKESDFMDIVNL
jgi:DNA polymerase-3 subunit epsilon